MYTLIREFDQFIFNDPILDQLEDDNTEKEKHIFYSSIFPPIMERYFPNTTFEVNDRLGIEAFYQEAFIVGIQRGLLEKDEYRAFRDEMGKREYPIRRELSIFHEKTKDEKMVRVAVFHNEQSSKSKIKERPVHFGEAATECSKLKFKTEIHRQSGRYSLKQEADKRLTPYIESIISSMEYLIKAYKFVPDPRNDEEFEKKVKSGIIQSKYQ